MTGLLYLIFFILKLVLNLALMVLWLRVILKFFLISPTHPISHMVHELTQPILGPLDNLMGAAKKDKSRYDFAGLLGIGIIELLKMVFLGLIAYHTLLPIPYILVLMIGDFIVQPINLLFYAVMIRVIMSWVNPQWHHPFADVLYSITEPFLRFVSRYVPVVSGWDLAAPVLLIALIVISFTVSAIMPLPLL